MEDDPQRIEYTRIGFGIIGKMLDTLTKEPNDALIVLALTQGDTTVPDILGITDLHDITIERNLQRLLQTKVIHTYVLHNRNLFGLTETGKALANAWIAFMKNVTTATILPKKDRDRIRELIDRIEIEQTSRR